MQNLGLQSARAQETPLDLVAEVLRLESLLAARQDELTALQEALREFRTRYTQIVGSRLAELSEIEQSIREAESRRLGAEHEAEEAGEAAPANDILATEKLSVERGLRKLFWSVAKLFHPDHAADASEAKRRHTIMVEAGRAYREGDVESLHTLLGDEELHFFCTTASTPDDDLPARLIALKEELRTVEFGLKRLAQDGMYRLKVKADAEAAAGRDSLAAEAERISRQIVKARHRLTNLD